MNNIGIKNLSYRTQWTKFSRTPIVFVKGYRRVNNISYKKAYLEKVWNAAFPAQRDEKVYLMGGHLL
jgi:hypothetical protein